MAFLDWLNKRNDVKKQTNTIDKEKKFKYNNIDWEIRLPENVFKQKEMLSALDKYYNQPSAQTERDLLDLIIQNTTMNRGPVNTDILDLKELNVIKEAYIDLLLLPLFQWEQAGLVEFQNQIMSQNL